MELRWLKQEGNPTCLFFLAGWGMDEHPFAGVPSSGYDILLGYDDRTLEQPPADLFKPYTSCHLIAWSMGVWVAGHILKGLQHLFANRIAIGGTLDPVHPTRGIPPESYDAILQSSTPETIIEFYQSMFDDEATLQTFLNNRPQRARDAIWEELAAFKNHYLTHGGASDIFTHKYVTSRDRVFPLKNQRKAWGKDGCSIVKLPHFPFYAISEWQELLPQ